MYCSRIRLPNGNHNLNNKNRPGNDTSGASGKSVGSECCDYVLNVIIPCQDGNWKALVVM